MRASLKLATSRAKPVSFCASLSWRFTLGTETALREKASSRIYTVELSREVLKQGKDAQLPLSQEVVSLTEKIKESDPKVEQITR